MSRGITCLLLCLIGLCVALPSATFNREPSVNVLQNHQPKNVEDAFYVVGALQALHVEPKEKTAFCNLANEELSNASDIKSIYFATFVAEDLNCAKRANEKVAALVFKTPSYETTEELFYGTMAAFRLRSRKHLSFEPKKFHSVLESFSDLTAVDGTVKNSMGDARGTLYHSGLAYQASSVIAEAGGLSSDQELVLSIFKENVESLLELYTETDDGVVFVDNDDSRASLRTTNSLIQGAFDMLDDLDVLIEAEVLDDVTSHMLANAPHGDIREIYYFAHLMSLITSGKVPTTHVVALDKTSYSSSIKNDGNVVIAVTDLMGGVVRDLNVFLMKASSFADDSVVYSNQQLTKVNDREYSFNFFTSKPPQGFYYLEFGVQAGKNAPIRTTFRTIKVVTSVSVGTVTANVIDTSDKEIVQTSSAQSGKQFTPLKATYFNSLLFQFTIKNQATNKPTRIQQAFIRFEGADSEASFPAQWTGEGYSLALDMKDVGRDLSFLTGEYSMYLIIGDAFIDNSSVSKLGTVTVNFPPSLEVKAHESVYDEKPEIAHTFRVPDKRPSESVSFAFTIAVLCPVVILFFGFIATGINIKFPSGLGFIFSILFLACIYGIFATYAGFWLGQYNMFQTLKSVGVLSIGAFFFGNRALRYKGASRKASEEHAKSE